VNDGGGSGGSCGGIKVRTDTMKLSNTVIVIFCDGQYLFAKVSAFIKNDAKVARVGGVK